MNDDILFITDDDGNEVAMKQLFNFYSDEFKKSYVLYTDPESEDGQVYAMSFDDDKNLYAVETEQEWDLIEEVFGACYEQQEQD